jgi:hypothetical protein
MVRYPGKSNEITHSMMNEYLTLPASLIRPTSFWIGYMSRSLSRTKDMSYMAGFQEVNVSEARSVAGNRVDLRYGRRLAC